MWVSWLSCFAHALPQLTFENRVGYEALNGEPCVACLKYTTVTVSLVSSWHNHKRGAIVNNFQLATNIVLDVIFAMFIIFPSGGLLKISLDTFLPPPLHNIGRRLWRPLVGRW